MPIYNCIDLMNYVQIERMRLIKVELHLSKAGRKKMYYSVKHKFKRPLLSPLKFTDYFIKSLKEMQ